MMAYFVPAVCHLVLLVCVAEIATVGKISLVHLWFLKAVYDKFKRLAKSSQLVCVLCSMINATGFEFVLLLFYDQLILEDFIVWFPFGYMYMHLYSEFQTEASFLLFISHSSVLCFTFQFHFHCWEEIF